MATFIYYNNYNSTIATALSSSGTSIVVDSAGDLTTPSASEELRLTIVNPLDPDDFEIVKCTAVSGTTLTVVRQIEGPVSSAWSVGSIISARLTAEMLDGMAAGFDNGGDAKGSGAVNLQSERTLGTQVASGANSVTVGPYTTASGSSSIAMGDDAEASSFYSLAIGKNVTASGNFSIAIGSIKDAIGDQEIQIGSAGGGSAIRSRDYSTRINSFKPTVAEYTKAIGGFEYVAQHNGDYSGSAADYLTAGNTLAETIIYSDPVNLGSSPSWAATTEYSHGDVIFPTTSNNYCYLCSIWDSDYHAQGDSGGTEPTWPTTAGDTVADGDLEWICVDPDDYQMLMPDYLRFIPTEVGFIADTISDTTQPYISFGINGNLTKWLASTQTTDLTADYTIERFTPTNNEGAKQFGAGLVTAGTGNYTGRFYWKGLVVEVASA